MIIIDETLNLSPVNGGILVSNAGCVLISGYFSMLFERLGIMANDKFLDEKCRQKAVHYLQYIVTGLSSTEESDLSLNKVLCGIPVTQAIVSNIHISEEDNELVNGLISAVLSHWIRLHSSNIDSFRTDWLTRNGLLTEHDDKWELVFEHHGYDILLQTFPLTFSTIKHPWMDKPLYVYVTKLKIFTDNSLIVNITEQI